MPLLGRSRTIAMDGAVVWQDGAPAAGVTAVQRDGAVEFSDVTGSHTFAFGTVTTDTGGTVGGVGARHALAEPRDAGGVRRVHPGRGEGLLRRDHGERDLDRG